VVADTINLKEDQAMRWFENLSTTLKIGLLATVLILALGYSAMEAYSGYSGWASYSQVVRDNRLPTIEALGAMNAERMQIRAQTVEILAQYEAYQDKRRLREIANERMRSWQVIDRHWTTLERIPRLTEEGRRTFERLTQEYRAWRSVYTDLDRLIAELITINDRERFAHTLAEYQATVGRMVPISDRMGATFVEMVEGNMRRATAQANTNVEQSETEIRRLIVASVVMLLIAALLAILTLLSLVRPLRALVQHFAAIGHGDLNQAIATGRRDEVGRALTALAEMQIKLRTDITETRRIAAENLRIRYALDSVSSNVMVVNPEAQIIYANDAVLNMLRKASTALRKALPAFDPERVRGGNFDSFNLGQLRQAMGVMHSTQMSEYGIGGRTFKLVASPIFDGDGTRLGSVIEWTDRTEELSVEQEVTGLVEGAVKGDFTRRVSTDQLDGFFRRLGDGINLLVDRTAKGLAEVAGVLKAVAQGDLTHTVTGSYEGTFGELKDDTNETVAQLSALIGQITVAVDAIDNGAREIAHGNADLSQRTEEQASSLEETASSMEELTSTVKQTADNARQANQLAIGAQNVATHGGVKAREAMDSMRAITASANKIGEIISVIDGIAFQTNILALNAAVEAARAGEQGRGFAVVASEVRNLAQRSAAAAKEIKALIAEDTETIAAGSKQVIDAGQTMEEIVTQVKRVSDLIAEISAAADEQSSGIDQINTAINQMDEVTQQNASLVEEAAAAAESLEEQAQELSRAVAVFKVSSGQGRPDSSIKAARKPALPAAGRSTAGNAMPVKANTTQANPAKANPARAMPVKANPAKPPARTTPARGRLPEDDWEAF